MRILITGANGLLGYKLADLLSRSGEEVVATSRGSCRLPTGMYSEYHSMDITSASKVEEVITRIQPEVVIHAAAMTQVDDCELDKETCHQINVEGTGNMVAATEKSGGFFIHISTDFIFDGSHGPLEETASPSPVNYYGESKLQSEEIVMNSQLDWAIARTVLVYGITPTLNRSNIILWVHDKLSAGEQIRVVNDQYRTPTLAEDLAMGCYLIAKKHAKGVFNISGKDLLTPYEMALKVADHFTLEKSLIEETNSQEFRQPARRPLKTGFIIKKAQSILDYAPVSFDEGIEIVASQRRKK